MKRTNRKNKNHTKEIGVFKRTSKLSSYFTSILKLTIAVALFFIAALFANAAGIIIEDGALNVSNNLLVNTNTLYVDSANDLIGIGNSNPGAGLHIGNRSNAPSRGATGAEDAFIEGKLEVDGMVYLDNHLQLQYNFYQGDDSDMAIGGYSTGDAVWSWRTQDADAHNLQLKITPSATNVPVFSISDDTAFGTNLGWFNGIRDPSIALISDDASTRFRLFVKNDTDVFNVDVNGTTRMTIDSAGNVGIGAAPSAPLHITTDGSESFRMTRTGMGSAYIYISSAMVADGVQDTVDFMWDFLQASSGLLFNVRNDSNYLIPALGINKKGDVGINTLSPTSKLHVVGNANVTGTLAYGTLQSNSPHAFLQYDNNQLIPTQICLIADNNEVVMQTLHYNSLSGIYEWAFIENAPECLNKEVVEKIEYEFGYRNITVNGITQSERYIISQTEIKKKVFQ